MCFWLCANARGRGGRASTGGPGAGRGGAEGLRRGGTRERTGGRGIFECGEWTGEYIGVLYRARCAGGNAGAGRDGKRETEVLRRRRTSTEGRAVAFANRINALALGMTKLRAFRERQEMVFKVLAGVGGAGAGS